MMVGSIRIAFNIVYRGNSVVYSRVHEFLKSGEIFEIPKWTMYSVATVVTSIRLVVFAFVAISRARLTGTYTDFLATITIDSAVPASTLSVRFVNDNNVPRDVKTVRGVAQYHCFGPVVVPSADGWFHSRLPFKMAFHTHSDVVLGADCQLPKRVHLHC